VLGSKLAKLDQTNEWFSFQSALAMDVSYIPHAPFDSARGRGRERVAAADHGRPAMEVAAAGSCDSDQEDRVNKSRETVGDGG
jgi:hypothetical protein